LRTFFRTSGDDRTSGEADLYEHGAALPAAVNLFEVRRYAP
jgi:hypothetical protein